jgi:alkaline phosphatase D
MKVGEVSADAAIVWARATEQAERRRGPGPKPGAGGLLPAGTDPAALEGAVPGAPGRLRVRWSTRPDLSDAAGTEWVAVDAKTDFAHQFRLGGLAADTLYHVIVEAAGADGAPAPTATLTGSFRTAPPAGVRKAATFTVITGKAYKDLDHPEGYEIYPAMAALRPAFLVPTGDTVYYDNDPPRANSSALARYHWQRMYGLPRVVAFHRAVPAYWMKDDHDTLDDDCWPTRVSKLMAPLTFAEGQRIFREQVPIGERTYRRVRWGRALEVFLPEGRDFRSANNAPDGPDKTIWGAEQKAWLTKAIVESDADWKVLVSATPVVGPDRANKGDNHANKAFAFEGDWFRNWAAKNAGRNFFIVCGDRHWQYHSVHPGTGVQEFSCGPASDKHAGGSPGLNKEYHRFHRVKGGFLSVTVTPASDGGVGEIAFRFHDVQGAVVHEFKPPANR